MGMMVDVLAANFFYVVAGKGKGPARLEHGPCITHPSPPITHHTHQQWALMHVH